MLRSIQNKILHSGAIIENCLLKYVSGKKYDLQFILKFYFLLFVYKVINNKSSFQLKSLFISNSHTYSTRHKNFFIIPHCNTNLLKRNFSCIAPSYWNSLPTFVKTSCSSYQFRINLDHFLSGEAVNGV